MPQPDLGDDGDQKKSGGRLMSIVLGTLLTLAIVVALMVVTMGYILPMLVIGGAIAAFAAFHYLVWGWWLSGYLRDVDKDDEADRK